MPMPRLRSAPSTRARTGPRSRNPGALELVKEVRHTGPNCAPLPSPQETGPATTRRGLATGCNIASRTATRISIPCGTWSSPMPRRPSRATSARPAAPARPTAWSARRPAPTAIPSAPKTGTAGILRWDFQDKAGATGGLLSGAAGNGTSASSWNPETRRGHARRSRCAAYRHGPKARKQERHPVSRMAFFQEDGGCRTCELSARPGPCRSLPARFSTAANPPARPPRLSTGESACRPA